MNLMFCQLVGDLHGFCGCRAALWISLLSFYVCGHVHLLVFDLCLTIVVSHHFVVFSSLQIFLVSSFQLFSVTLSSLYISLQLFFVLLLLVGIFHFMLPFYVFLKFFLLVLSCCMFQFFGWVGKHFSFHFSLFFFFNFCLSCGLF